MNSISEQQQQQQQQQQESDASDAPSRNVDEVALGIMPDSGHEQQQAQAQETEMIPPRGHRASIASPSAAGPASSPFSFKPTRGDTPMLHAPTPAVKPAAGSARQSSTPTPVAAVSTAVFCVAAECA